MPFLNPTTNFQDFFRILDSLAQELPPWVMEVGLEGTSVILIDIFSNITPRWIYSRDLMQFTLLVFLMEFFSFINTDKKFRKFKMDPFLNFLPLDPISVIFGY